MPETPVPVGLICFVRKPGISLNRGKILTGIRLGSHAEGCLSAPGGSLRFGETFEQGGLREIKEECGTNLKVKYHPLNFPAGEVCTTNDPMLRWNKHFVSIWLRFDWIEGEPVNMEPDRCKGWQWRDMQEIVAALPKEIVTAWNEGKTLDPMVHPQAQWLPLSLLNQYRHVIGI